MLLIPAAATCCSSQGFSSANPHLAPSYQRLMIPEAEPATLGWQKPLMAQLKFWDLVPANKEKSPGCFLLPLEDLCCLKSFPSWCGAEVWHGRKCPGLTALISSVQRLPREDVEVSSQHFVSYCVAASRNCQALAFSHPGEGLHHGIFRKKQSGMAPPLFSGPVGKGQDVNQSIVCFGLAACNI